MNHKGKREYLINYLLRERNSFNDVMIPNDDEEQKRLLRSLMNVREGKNIDKEFLNVQDEYLKEVAIEKGIVDINDLKPIKNNIYLWQGDITRLKCDAIVNAANSGMTGCYIPCHNCIDNAIHTYAGVELRNYMNDIMMRQGHEEETGKAKISSAYNLPSKYIIHTVGPIVNGSATDEDKKLLKSCYNSCLNIVVENSIKSIAFCCISTGIFGFPKVDAAKIAVETVEEFNKEIKVVFNVFTDEDYNIYNKLLCM